MGPSTSKDSHNSKRSKSSDDKNHSFPSTSTDDEEKISKRRKEWERQQKLLREHEKLKEKKILEYEQRRAALKGLPTPRRYSRRRRYNRSRSRSSERHHSRKYRNEALSDQDSDTFEDPPIFRGPENSRISRSDLHSIKINIQTNSKVKNHSDELLRDILNPEDLVLKRRDGEGSKPLFERDEIKRTASREGEEIEEVRVVRYLTDEELAAEASNLKFEVKGTPQIPEEVKKHVVRFLNDDDLEPRFQRDEAGTRNNEEGEERRIIRIVIPDEESDMDKSPNHRCPHHSGEERRSRDRSRRRRDNNRSTSQRDRSSSSDRDNRKPKDFNRRSSSEERHHRDSPERSRDYSRQRRNWTRERRQSCPSHFVQEVPIPIYIDMPPPFANFLPGPILAPFRGQAPRMRGRPRFMRGPMRPFRPRFTHHGRPPQ